MMFEPAERPSRITIPKHAHPLARWFFAEAARQRLTYEEAEYRSGVLRSTLKSWRVHARPGLDTIEAVAGVLGWSILPVPKPEVLPPELRADLEALADKHRVSFPCLEFISAAAGRQPQTRLPHSVVTGNRPVSRRQADSKQWKAA